MKKDKKLLILGGDKRYIHAAESFVKKGYGCRVYGFDRSVTEDNEELISEDVENDLKEADYILLPIPYRKGEFLNTPTYKGQIYIEDILKEIDVKSEIFCGKVDELIGRLPNKIHDYSKREDFAILNAQLTAEAAIEIILRELPTSLKDTKTAILGYGRIGKALARLLHGFGNNFTVYARRDEIFAMLESCSYFYSDITQLEGLHRYDLVINTVPKTILFKEQLSAMKKGSTLLELASLPGGADKEAAADCGIRLIEARGLPGICSPVSAGRIICDCINKIIYSEA
ncbi:MAG: hypothetical protein E7623_00855 [Ruminococcaceae bacterium]|nr:hypothetical protein [Oscillospiraceae bacterium]